MGAIGAVRRGFSLSGGPGRLLGLAPEMLADTAVRWIRTNLAAVPIPLGVAMTFGAPAATAQNLRTGALPSPIFTEQVATPMAKGVLSALTASVNPATAGATTAAYTIEFKTSEHGTLLA